MTACRQALVLVGGEGRRLRARVPALPKPLAPVGGRPFVAYLLDSLAAQGIEHAIMSTGYLAEAVQEALGDHHGSMQLSYSREDRPLGTGGAVRLALRHLADEHFVLLNGDSFTPFDLGAMDDLAVDHDHGLVLTTCHQPEVARFGSLDLRDGWTHGMREKGRTGPGFINAGIYLVTPSGAEELATMPEAFSFETGVLEPWLSRHPLPTVESPGPFIDIGVPEDYDRAAGLLAGVLPFR